jgi:5-methylcytosine-specific restriction protein A
VRDGGSRCPAHPFAAWVRRADVTKRQTGRALQRNRAALFSREPLCRQCARTGVTTLAVIRDHIVPLAEGGPDTDDNVQPLCQACSDAKTAAESARGRAGVRSVLPALLQPQGGGGRKSTTPNPETDPGVGISCAQVSEKFS